MEEHSNKTMYTFMCLDLSVNLNRQTTVNFEHLTASQSFVACVKLELLWKTRLTLK